MVCHPAEREPGKMVRDGLLAYTNVFDAMVDSVCSGLEKSNGSSLDVVVSETGWPTAGGANIKNAVTHNNNLIMGLQKGLTTVSKLIFVVCLMRTGSIQR